MTAGYEQAPQTVVLEAEGKPVKTVDFSEEMAVGEAITVIQEQQLVGSGSLTIATSAIGSDSQSIEFGFNNDGTAGDTYVLQVKALTDAGRVMALECGIELI